MQVRSIKLFSFRNLADSTISFEPGVNVIIGKNGQGKTNLVEAISLISHTKSFRTSKLGELVRWGEKSASVFGEVETKNSSLNLGLSVDHGERALYVNGDKVRSATDFLGKLLVVSFSPTDLMLLQGAPSERRRFIDRNMVALTPSILGNIMSYQRAIQNKNKILREGITDISLLDPWNLILAREAALILRARREFVRLVAERASKIFQSFAPRDGALTLALKTNIHGETPSPEDLLVQYQEIRAREVARGGSILGPHRDDLYVEIGGRDAQAFASQGQTRSVVLALTLGVIELLEIRREDSPVVLLDDVNSELDAERSHLFFSLVPKGNRQIFITGTDSSIGELAGRGEFAVLEVSGGAVRDRSAGYPIAANGV